MVFRVFKLDVELLAHVYSHYQSLNLGKSLAEAIAGTSMVRNEAAWVTFLAIGSETKIIAEIPSFRQELHWLLPLVRVMTDCLEIDADDVAFLELVLT